MCIHVKKLLPRSWYLLVSTVGCHEIVIRLGKEKVSGCSELCWWFLMILFDRQAPIGDDNYLLLAARVRRLDSSQLRKTCSLPNWQWLDQCSTKVQHICPLLHKSQWLSRYSCDTVVMWLLWGSELYEQLFLSGWHLGRVKLGILASTVMWVIFQLSSICCYVRDVRAYLKTKKWLVKGGFR